MISSTTSDRLNHPSLLAYEASDWAPLMDQLARDVADLRGSDPLRPVTILLSSVGKKIWLTRELALRHGVAANIHATYPRQLIAQIAKACGIPSDAFSAFDQEPMTWRIHRALGETERIAGTPLQSYLSGDAYGRKRVRLAQRLADTFDRYMAYRPDWILQWDAAESTQSETETWQSRLWRAATADLPKPLTHFPAFLQTLNSKRSLHLDASLLPPALFLLGITGIPPAYIKVFSAISQFIPVRVYQTIPSADFLVDLPKTAEERAEHLLHWETADWNHHPLLMTCGKTARVLRARFMDDFEDHLTLETPEATTDALLHQLQGAIRSNDGLASLPPPDGSITIDSCHGPMREVEVLRDRLLAALDEIPGLRPRDILVLSPNLAESTSFIHSVFGSVPKDDKTYLPYSIADKSVADERPSYALAATLLGLPRSRMTAEEVSSLLESPVTATRMRWDDRDLDLIRIKLKDAKVSWGADASDRAAVSCHAMDYGTWRDFLSRLRLGFALGENTTELYHDRAPLPGIESGQSEVLGGLADRIERLLSWRQTATQLLSVPEWCDHFITEINAWLPTHDDAFADESKTLRDLIHRLAKSATLAGFCDAIPYSEFSEFLKPSLSLTDDGGRFLTEGITFTALKPLRAIPARVIALLGVNAQNFPRRNQPDGFDLMTTHPAATDPDKTAEDRGIFLDTILAARDRLLLIVTGNSAEDNKELPLSPVVDELLRAICPKSDDPNSLIVRQPPFPYSLKYHEQAASAKHSLFTFDTHATRAAQAHQLPTQPAYALFPPSAIPAIPADYPQSSLATVAPNTPETLTWAEFSSFYTEFETYCFKHRLGIQSSLNTDQWPEDELPNDSTKSLDSYLLKDNLLRIDQAPSFHHAAATGMAYPSGLGNLTYDEHIEKSNALREKLILDIPDAHEYSFNYSFPIGHLTLHFENRLWTNDQTSNVAWIRPGNVTPKHQLRAELIALALSFAPNLPATPHPRQFLLISEKKPFKYPILPRAEALAKLERLLVHFLLHRHTISPFNADARIALRSDKPPHTSLALTKKFDLNNKSARSNFAAEMIWSDAILSTIETWSPDEIQARVAYERWLWSIESAAPQTLA